MTLSIIIPVYNVEAYVGQCLDSVYDGEVDPSRFEVIVVNDGSTDDSSVIIDGYDARYDNLTVITQENQGLSMARMNGLARAQGDYIWFVDSDDYLANHAIRDLFPLIQNPDSPSVVMAPVRRLDTETGASNLDYVIDEPRLMDGMAVLLDSRFPKWTASRFILRRSLFENGHLFFPKGLIHEDQYFDAVLLMLSDKVLVYDKAFFNHRIRPGSIMQTISIRSSYDYVSNYSLLKEFSKTLKDTSKAAFLHYSQRLLSRSYFINEKIWPTSEFRRFKCEKSPYIVLEFLRNARNYSFQELANLILLTLAPKAFRKRYPRGHA